MQGLGGVEEVSDATFRFLPLMNRNDRLDISGVAHLLAWPIPLLGKIPRRLPAYLRKQPSTNSCNDRATSHVRGLVRASEKRGRMSQGRLHDVTEQLE